MRVIEIKVRWQARGISVTPRIACKVFRVPSRVDPPAPNVTVINIGLYCESVRTVSSKLCSPCGVFGGKNSKLMLGALIDKRVSENIV